ADFRSRVRRILFSPLPERYHLYNYEQLIDFDAAESYTVEHLPRRGLTETQTLTGGGAELMKATVQWRTAPAASTMVVCAYDALTTALNMSFGSCFGGAAPARRSFVHHVTNERAAYAHNGMVFNVAGVETQALRGRDGRIVMSSAVTLPLTVERITPGGTLTVGTGPVYPFAIPGTRVAQWFRVPPAGFATATGELVTGGTGMEWTTFDAAGNTTASGSWRGQQGGQAPPAPQSQSKLMARRYDLPTAAGMTRGTLEVTFGTTTDLEAPTLTSLRVVDAAGNTNDRLRAGEHALLQFSVADLNYAHAAEAMPTRPEATRAWFRIAGTDAWQPLALSITGSETGDLNAIGHVPAGDLYSASLDAATASGNARIDIRIEFADPAGNSVRWTHESAITVGNPAAPSQRRRSVRN
ncbi:MAG TPA: hypothetical protein VE010_01395, partial [Thermoanaerobaculia bacterium]|nr:hypothetical protein [Thermoanaerobaculia bacterium]